MKADVLAPDTSPEVAVIGLACRFPGARNADQFWENLRSGVESITFLSDEELRRSGIGAATRGNPRYVKAAPLLDSIENFDARFFGYSPHEARLMDPQQRLFLETAWEALEHAGYDPGRYDGPIGVYAGSAMNTYLLYGGVLKHLADEYLLTVSASDKDFLTTRVSYKLGLTGPSIAVQTACSTSLVAVHIACQSLLGGECDMALAGGVSVKVPHRAGYLHEPGGVLSPDGHCRAFDARARGTLFGSGMGLVVLKRLADAVADGDYVHAVIKGSAVNNDGSGKVEYAAPSVGSQSEVIVEALAHAGVDADAISYVEAHGTATALGDPIEVAALTKAFRRTTARTGFCAIGSVKTNVGHLDAAAGVAGLIKTILALKHGWIPASLHFEAPNPEIDFPSTPFHVNTALAEWPAGPAPRRASVNALGIGGTNAHVVLEEAPVVAPSGASRPAQLVVLSARTPTALEATTQNLSRRLLQSPAPSLADVAYTLQVGRKAFDHRRVLVCRDPVDAATALDQLAPTRVFTSRAALRARPVVFLLPGGGSQYRRMGQGLYATEAAFRDGVERGIDELRARLDFDLRPLFVAGSEQGGPTTAELRRPSVQLPAIFLVEHALASLWMSWGVLPSAMIGHSMGEVTAACLAGVFTFEDALRLMVVRGRLVESASSGEMLSVGLAEADVAPLLGDSLDMASVNTPNTCVVSGPLPAIDELARRLSQRGVDHERVPIATGAHSQLLDPVLGRFEADLRALRLAAPSIPFISNVTGTWITPAQAVDPTYWVKQLRSTVRFADGVRELLRQPDRLFLEVGPGRTLSSFVRLHPDRTREQVVIPSMPHPLDPEAEVESLLNAVGRVWLAGLAVDWARLTANERRYRLPLPTYPFEGQRYWADQEGASDGAYAERTPGWSIQRSARRAASTARPVATRLRSLLRRLLAPSDARGQRPLDDRPVASARLQADASPGAPPRNAVERELAAIWQDVLGVPVIGIHDDFFELGGTSILLTRIMARVNERWRVELSLVTMLESPTVAGLAQCVEAVGRTASTSHVAHV